MTPMRFSFLAILVLLSSLFTGCSDSRQAQQKSDYLAYAKAHERQVALFYQNPSQANFDAVGGVWKRIPDLAVPNEKDVRHTANVIHVFITLATQRYGLDAGGLNGVWTSHRLRDQALQNSSKMSDLLRTWALDVDVLDYYWSAYSVTGDVSYARFVNLQMESFQEPLARMARTSFNRMLQMDDRLRNIGK